MRRAPAFWFRPHRSWQTLALWPLEMIWRIGAARRARQSGTRVAAKVICVGNLTVGGTGKTPLVIALAERLQGAGRRVTVVSKGHGGAVAGPHKVDAARDRAEAVGDEPLLIAQFAPVIVAKDRLAGCEAAVKAGAEVILFDDGYQDPRVLKDLNLLVVDAATGFGNGRLVPAGPLREPVQTGLARADLVVLVGAGEVETAGRSTLRAEIRPLDTGMDWAGTRVLAFAGIGRPAKFFATLEALGAEIADRVELGDHEPISTAMLQRLTRRAAETGAQLVTTEKDMVRIAPEHRMGILALPVRLVPEDWAPLDAQLQKL